ncbi:hypothetical protein [Legionella quinlivanii]|uniref:hypothetical protein n=1 Tax=Legionella quinlivanii TaxID=45073 RepID=UPI002243529B|nr:hypothetical protein [Legionella quinlivanii]MCW8451483.1 hypothetical protein [Legionella quinlivanii]
MKFYHATALANYKKIKNEGLRINQRGKNKYGLDHKVDYAEIYGSESEASHYRKKPCIHFTKKSNVNFYSELIKDSFNVGVKYLEIDIDPDQYDVETDPEDNDSYICFDNIPPECIKSIELDQKKQHDLDTDESDSIHYNFKCGR